jgi:ornithine cyclodeaminase
MVDYIGVERVQELVTRIGLARFMEALATEIETDYRRWREFDKSPRHATHSSVGVIELMPISDGRLYSFKYVNGHPKNTAEGLLTVTAFGVLADVETGYPLLLSELTFTTALRTAAMSALAARRMARPASRVMALIGNGAQSEFQAIAFHHMVGIRELRLYDTDTRATLKLERNLLRTNLQGLKIVRCASTAEAVRGADIVTTVTADKRNALILTPQMIRPGMHINAVGGDCPGKTELHADILRRPDARVIVEFEPQCRIEGEIQQLESWFPVAEFSDVLAGKAVARAGDNEVTIFDSVGFALTDFSALRYLYRLNRDQRTAPEEIDLVPDLDDPKDLFGGLAREDGLSRQPRSSWPVSDGIRATDGPRAIDTRIGS